MTPQERQRAIMAYINRFWSQHCYSPTVREIAAACNVPSTSVVRYTLEQLEADGQLTVAANVPRSIVPRWVASAIGRGGAR